MGCASAPTVLTRVEIKIVEVPVRVPLDDELLQNPLGCFLPPTVSFYFFDLDIWALCLERQVKFYQSQLNRIREANAGPPDGG